MLRLIKKITSHTITLSIIFTACWSMQLLGDPTPFTQPIIEIATTIKRAQIDAQSTMIASAPNLWKFQKDSMLSALSAEKATFSEELARAFKFKDCAMVAQYDEEESEQLDRLLVKEDGIIHHFDVLRIFQTIADSFSMRLTHAAFEVMISHPIDQHSLDVSNNNRAIIACFQNFSVKECSFLKNQIAKTAEIEKLIINKKSDLLQKWVDDQEQGFQFFQVLKNRITSGLTLKGLGVAIASSCISPWVGVLDIAGSSALGIGSAAYSFLTRGDIATSLSDNAVCTLTSYGSYLTPAGHFLLGNGIRAGFSTAFTGLTQYQSKLGTYKSLCELQDIARSVIKKLAKHKKPELDAFINDLFPITEIDVTEKQYNPCAAALKVTQALYALAECEMYLALAHRVKSGTFVMVKDFSETKGAQACQNYIRKMYSLVGKNMSDNIAHNQTNTQLKLPPAKPLLLEIDADPTANHRNILTITLPIIQNKESMIQNKLQQMILKELFNIAYIAQALGIVPTLFKDEILLPLNFQGLALETKQLKCNGLGQEELVSLHFPIA